MKISQITLVYLEYSLTFSSGDLEVHVDFLVQIDKLVQLIESPIFTCELFIMFILTIVAKNYPTSENMLKHS